jgi:hypothetical protein
MWEFLSRHVRFITTNLSFKFFCYPHVPALTCPAAPASVCGSHSLTGVLEVPADSQGAYEFCFGQQPVLLDSQPVARPVLGGAQSSHPAQLGSQPYACVLCSPDASRCVLRARTVDTLDQRSTHSPPPPRTRSALNYPRHVVANGVPLPSTKAGSSEQAPMGTVVTTIFFAEVDT